MDRRDFTFELPRELIAQRPLPERSASRLLALDGATGRVQDLRFPDLAALLAPGDLLVLNDTRVLPARLVGRKESGGRVELLLERIDAERRARVQLKASHPPKAGQSIELPGGARARVLGRDGQLFDLELDRDVESYFGAHGLVPLPPYIERAPEDEDRERYQTVFARRPGAVAAPTAGLHFDAAMLDALERRGVERAFLTLHVGAGTFSPVRTERVEEHRLHAERLAVPPGLVAAVERTRARGGRVVAVGTTVVRGLETAARGGRLEPYEGDTGLFIYPPYQFRVVDALVTNFHLPESSLLMLVAAFAGREQTLAAYRHAVAERYRFFSYGDAMFVTPAATTASSARDDSLEREERLE
ncbi:MAG TPA: tRNA preQ1(34) S-adenosylmethionine ribosyltransferase-isomerase QueA [Gammaproteobacteria bacterium]|nr:tRNA preQ1(34) S-adenosylmethionine ribosyltransferase-isomerase QueA [Gammaproteobacteria bacterium]